MPHVGSSDLLASRAGLEAVLGAAADVLEVAHAAGTGGLSALSLLAPLVRADLGGGVTARGADLLLEVEGTGVATTAHSVRLGAIQMGKVRRKVTDGEPVAQGSVGNAEHK